MKLHYLSICLTLVLLVGCTSAPKKPGPGAGLPICGLLPNCVNSESGDGDKAIDPILATLTQWRELKVWLATQQDWIIENDTSDFLQAVTKTPLMHFSDDVQLRYDETAGLIHVRSSSRLGISDMGANRRRVEMVRELLASESMDQGH
ncbi:MAG: hypothetical protein ACI9GW_000804 [Halieaceae bacterium]|jgi:uncharacterized protein (DUF1499 family)